MTHNKIDAAYQELGRSFAHVYKGLLLGGLTQEDATFILGLYIDSVLTQVTVSAEAAAEKSKQALEEGFLNWQRD